MQYVRGLKDYKNENRSAVTFGKFDGLHRGHQKLVRAVAGLGEREGLERVVCAFDMFPDRALMTKEEKREYLSGQVDTLIDCPFTRDFREVEAEDFIRDIIVDTFHAKYVAVGTDFHFGHGKRGDARMLKAYEGKYGYEVLVIEKERHGGRIISSTYIKEMLGQGNMPLTNELLGYTYGISGAVEHGNKIGRTLGFPTVNIPWPENKIAPPKGVYLCKVKIEGQIYDSVANLGVKPTVSDADRILLEPFLFGYEGEAYGKEAEAGLLEFVRPEQRFGGKSELKARIERDISYAERYFGLAAHE